MTRPPTADPVRATLLTSDGVRLRAAHRPSADESRELAFVAVHGFTGAYDSEAMLRAANVLAQTGGVVTVSMRGHRGSAGASTLGDREVLDVDAAVRWARSLGYRAVVTVGFSMGASVVVRHAAVCGGVEAVVSVSGPSRWYYRGTPAMRRVHSMVGSRVGRSVVRWGRGTRVTDQAWSEPLPIEPRVAAVMLGPTRLLVVHGDADHYFPLDHARQLAAAGPHVELWVEYGFEHAENAISDELTARIARWAEQAIEPALARPTTHPPTSPHPTVAAEGRA
jgi:pimeloyl-ACP methyl ester carboxylesterase